MQIVINFEKIKIFFLFQLVIQKPNSGDERMEEKLQEWIDLLIADGIGSKTIVHDEMVKCLENYEECLKYKLERGKKYD